MKLGWAVWARATGVGFGRLRLSHSPRSSMMVPLHHISRTSSAWHLSPFRQRTAGGADIALGVLWVRPVLLAATAPHSNSVRGLKESCEIEKLLRLRLLRVLLSSCGAV